MIKKLILFLFSCSIIYLLLYIAVHHEDKNTFWDGAIWGLGVFGIISYLVGAWESTK